MICFWNQFKKPFQEALVVLFFMMNHQLALKQWMKGVFNMQYLWSLKSEIKKSLCSIEKLGRRNEPEETLLYICKSNDIREFDERETFLNDKEKFHLLVRQLKQIGGSLISASVNKVLDETMSKSVQSLFNKAGRHGKRPFRKTLLYKAIIETLVSHSTKSVLVDKLIGDHLKRAPDRIE
ncbi:uncharacterized protein LOC136090244 [Hydra vulgaris]|uniref:Uncharacterized protein LOC136090244 n=1 Tax=Hydra vulgaris TaxID=6087 RepID=A0ABM4DDR3_HYDVU